MKKSIEIHCDPAIQAILITALRNYTEVAFPPHSADCAQVARNAMTEAIDKLESALASTGKGEYNKRLRAMFKEGVKLHYKLAAAESAADFSNEEKLLLDVCQGVVATNLDLDAARTADGREA